jgi:hypothetical protein
MPVRFLSKCTRYVLWTISGAKLPFVPNQPFSFVQSTATAGVWVGSVVGVAACGAGAAGGLLLTCAEGRGGGGGDGKGRPRDHRC